MTGGRIRARALSLLPAALWYRLIWGFSAQTAAVSGNLSDRLLYRLLEALSPAFALSAQPARAAAVELLSFFERKAAHMFLYFILALLVWFAVCFFTRRPGMRIGLTALACVLLATLDEYHQTMVPGRSGELRDVLVDLCGAGAALGFLALPHLARWSRKSLSFPLPALVPAALALLCVCLALRPPEILSASYLSVWAAERFVPEAGSMSPEALAGLLEQLAPSLRDALFLTASGVSGVFIPMAGLLAGLSRRTVCLAACAAAAAAVILSWGAGAALPLAAGGMAALGALGMGALWGVAQARPPLQWLL